MGTISNRKAPKNETLEFRLFSATLKTFLKSKKMTYRDLAKKLGRSESGIKKILSAKDCSINRLNEICGALEVSLADLVQSMEQAEFSDVQFTVKQQDFFVSHMECFHFFWKLVFERLSVKEIETQFGLNSKQSFRFLKQLDDIDLIELNPGGHVRIPKLRNVRTFGDGPLIRKIYKEWSKKLIDEIAVPGEFKNRHFVFRGVRLKESSYQQFLKDLNELETKIVKTSIREMTLEPKDLVFVSWISGLANQSFVQRI